MTETKFKEYLEENGITINDNQLKLLKKYADYLLDYNKTTNLTAIKTLDDV